MIFSVDTDILKKYKLTIGQYFLCYLITQGDLEELADYIANTSRFSTEDLKILEEKGFIINLNKTSEYFAKNFQTTSTFMEIAGIGKYNSLFEEFWDTYPTKTAKGRRLKQSAKHKIEKKYNNIIKLRVDAHSHIIKCLQHEIEERTRTNSLEFFHNIETWLNKEGWKAYEEDLKDNPEETGFGGKLL